MHILLLVQQTVQLLWNSQNGSQRHRWLVIFPSGVHCIFVSVLSVLWTYFLVLVLSSVEFWGRDAAADSFTFQWESSGPVQSLLITSMQRPSLNSFNTRLKRICLNRRKDIANQSGKQRGDEQSANQYCCQPTTEWKDLHQIQRSPSASNQNPENCCISGTSVL